MKDIRLKKRIEEMVKVDQEARTQAKNSRGLQIPNILIYTLDSSHNYWIHKIIQQYGYPTSKMVGADGMKSFWLLVQHQDFDLELQESCLKNCDFALQEQAYLTDRICVNSGKKQIYGTQFNSPIEDEKNVNEKRSKMGLSTIEEYLKGNSRT